MIGHSPHSHGRRVRRGRSGKGDKLPGKGKYKVAGFARKGYGGPKCYANGRLLLKRDLQRLIREHT